MRWSVFEIPVVRLRQLTGVLNFLWKKAINGHAFSTRGLSLFRIGSELHIGRRGAIAFEGRASIAPHARLAAEGELAIGRNFTLNSYSRVVALERISIGQNVTIARFVSILDHDHKTVIEEGAGGRSLTFDGYSCAPITIGSNVWIGDKVSVLKGVSIGNNVIVGANSVVVSDIPDFCVAVGAPARVVKRL